MRFQVYHKNLYFWNISVKLKAYWKIQCASQQQGIFGAAGFAHICNSARAHLRSQLEKAGVRRLLLLVGSSTDRRSQHCSCWCTWQQDWCILACDFRARSSPPFLLDSLAVNSARSVLTSSPNLLSVSTTPFL